MKADQAYKLAADLLRKYPFLEVKTSPGRYVDGWTVFAKFNDTLGGVEIDIMRLMFSESEVRDLDCGLAAIVAIRDKGDY
jgi:hypothetical protein